MAKFEKGNKLGKKVKKGEVLNPNGRPRKFVTEMSGMPEGYKPSQVAQALAIITQLSEDELFTLSRDHDASVLERTCAYALLNGMKDGDTKAITFLLERSIGKPVQSIEIDATVRQVQRITLPDGTILEL